MVVLCCPEIARIRDRSPSVLPSPKDLGTVEITFEDSAERRAKELIGVLMREVAFHGVSQLSWRYSDEDVCMCVCKCVCKFNYTA